MTNEKKSNKKYLWLLLLLGIGGATALALSSKSTTIPPEGVCVPNKHEVLSTCLNGLEKDYRDCKADGSGWINGTDDCYHNGCSGGKCIAVKGDVPHECSSNAECQCTPICTPGDYVVKTKCKDGTPKSWEECSADGCKWNPGSWSCTHKECQNQKCVSVWGDSDSTCSQDGDCFIPPTPAKFDIINAAECEYFPDNYTLRIKIKNTGGTAGQYKVEILDSPFGTYTFYGILNPGEETIKETWASGNPLLTVWEINIYSVDEVTGDWVFNDKFMTSGQASSLGFCPL